MTRHPAPRRRTGRRSASRRLARWSSPRPTGPGVEITTPRLTVTGYVAGPPTPVRISLQGRGNRIIETQVVEPTRDVAVTEPQRVARFSASFAVPNPRPNGEMLVEIALLAPDGHAFDVIWRYVAIGAVGAGRRAHAAAGRGRRDGRPDLPDHHRPATSLRPRQIRAAAAEPVAQGPGRGLEGERRPRDGVGREGRDLGRFRRRAPRSRRRCGPRTRWSRRPPRAACTARRSRPARRAARSPPRSRGWPPG